MCVTQNLLIRFVINIVIYNHFVMLGNIAVKQLSTVEYLLSYFVVGFNKHIPKACIGVCEHDRRLTM